MLDIIALLLCLHPEMTMTSIRQFSRIALALLAMTGRVTMLGISRWSGQGGSYRIVSDTDSAIRFRPSHTMQCAQFLNIEVSIVVQISALHIVLTPDA